MTTLIRDWRPGQPLPPDVVILGPTPAATLHAIEERLRWNAERIAGHRAVLRATTHADRVIWHPAAQHALDETRIQYRALLRARRAVRQMVERDEDRVEAEAKNPMAGPLWDRHLAGDR